jgi:hypothetical protein
MQETRKVNDRYTGEPIFKKWSKQLRMSKEDVVNANHKYIGGGWREVTYETDIPWEYR